MLTEIHFRRHDWSLQLYTQLKQLCITAMINHVFICFSTVQIYDLLCIQLHNHLLRVYYELIMWPAPSWLYSSVGRALHWYRWGHGFKFHSGLNFFQALILQLLKLCSYVSLQFKYMIIHIFICRDTFYVT